MAKSDTGSLAPGVPVEIVPLGGLGEFGLNMMAYRLADSFILVDAGLLFPSHDTPGVDLLLPDTSHVDAHASIFKGIVLTHGHEDHIGALPYLLKHYQVPVYGTPLTLGIVKRRLEEHGLLGSVDLREATHGERFELGDFRIEFVRVAHSLADSVAVVIDTPYGAIVHTGDFKIDEAPPIGPPIDMKRFAQLGREGVLCLLSDSTNAEVPGHTGTESSVEAPLEEIFEGAPGRVLVCCFASSTHRVQIVLDLAKKHGRKVLLAGRSMNDILGIASDLEYLRVPPDTLWPLEEANDLPLDKQVLLTAGSQGEPMSALSNIANGTHRHVKLAAGDRVAMSSRVIPGNERSVNRVVNQLFRLGADVYSPPGAKIHVSGHGSADDLRMLLDIVKPRHFIPIHGEWRQLYSHARLARQSEVPNERVFIAEDGDVMSFDEDGGKLTDKIETGIRLVDATGLGLVDDCVIRDRRRLSATGILVPLVFLSGNEPTVSDILSRGFIDSHDGEAILAEAHDLMLQTLGERSADATNTEGELEELLETTLKRFFRKKSMRRPVILPVVVSSEKL